MPLICALGRCPWSGCRASAAAGDYLWSGMAPILAVGKYLRHRLAHHLAVGKRLRHCFVHHLALGKCLRGSLRSSAPWRSAQGARETLGDRKWMPAMETKLILWHSQAFMAW